MTRGWRKDRGGSARGRPFFSPATLPHAYATTRSAPVPSLFARLSLAVPPHRGVVYWQAREPIVPPCAVCTRRAPAPAPPASVHVRSEPRPVATADPPPDRDHGLDLFAVKSCVEQAGSGRHVRQAFASHAIAGVPNVAEDALRGALMNDGVSTGNRVGRGRHVVLRGVIRSSPSRSHDRVIGYDLQRKIVPIHRRKSDFYHSCGKGAHGWAETPSASHS